MNVRPFILALVALLVAAVTLVAEDPAPRITFGNTADDKMVKLPGAHETNSWTVEASTDLVRWVDLGEILEINGTGDFPDPSARLLKKRYYRAIHHGRNIQAALDRNRARWERSGINDYDFTFQWLCFCAPDYVARVNISVRDGQITAVSRVEDGRDIDPSDFDRYRTVDGLFDLLQDAIDREAHSISARFAPRTGAPKRAWIDYNRMIADEERGFVVEELRVAGATSVQITDRPAAELQLDPFSLQGATISGNTLAVNIQHSGGCAEHDYELFMSPSAFMESFPVQANLYLRHNAHGDLCKALIMKELTFDLTPIAELYGPPDPIILNIYDYFTDEPGNRIRVTYDRSAVQITDTPPAKLQLDPFTLEAATIDKDTLTLTVQHSGGCRPHRYELFMSPGAFMESFPVQANLYLRHDANGDLCEALIRNEISFNLSPISKLYGQPGTIILNIYEHFSGDPVNRIQVDYEQER